MNASPIVVGFDGSAGALAGLRWAFDDAARRRLPVNLVYALRPPVAPDALFPVDLPYPDQGRCARAQEMLDGAAAARPDVSATTEVVDGPAVSALCERSCGATLVVVGSRGHGGLAGLLLGSVSSAVTTHAACPVVVVRGDDPIQRDQPIVVGVDDSAGARAALAFAAEEAALRGVKLVAVRAWRPPSAPWRSDIRPLVADVADLETAERHLLKASISGCSATYPHLRVSTRLMPGDAPHALAEASQGAQLVVVGSRGRGFAGLVLGSVGQHLLHHAPCPVAVVRARPAG